MIRFPATIFVATAPIDLRLSFDRLAGVVREQLGADPHAEAVFVFHNRNRTHLKILWHEKRGYCLFYKRLDRGVYRIPLAIPAGARSVQASAAELAVLLDGLDTAALRAARRSARTGRTSTTSRRP